MNNNKKTIDFEIKFTKFPFDREKLRSIMSDADLETVSNTTKKKPKGALKMSMIITSLIALISTGLILMNSGNCEKETNITPVAILHGDIAAPVQNRSAVTPEKTAVSSKKTTKDNSTNLNSGVNFKLAEDSRDNRNLTLKLPVYFLTDTELEKLNVFRNGNGYLIITESLFGFGYSPNYKYELAGKNYPESGIFHVVKSLDTFSIEDAALLPYTNWDLNKSEGVYPFSVFIKFFHDRNSTGRLSSSFGISPLTQPLIERKLNADLDVASKIFLETNYLKILTPEDSIFLYATEEMKSTLSNFIPVYISIGGKEKGSRGIIWFPATKHLLERLPDRYKVTNINSFWEENITDYTPKLNSMPEIQKEPTKQPVFVKKSIGDIESLEMSADELKKLGIEFANGTVSAIFESRINIDKMQDEYRNMIIDKFAAESYDVSKPSLLVKTNNIADKNGYKQVPVKYTGWDYNNFSRTAPIAVTYSIRIEEQDKKHVSISVMKQFSDYSPLLDSIKNRNSMLEIDQYHNYKPTTNKIIPVLVNVGKANSSTDDTIDVVNVIVKVWFLVNREFAKLLPERYSLPIMKELDIIDELEEGKITSEGACEALRGEKSYLNLCQLSSGNIRNFTVSPNPIVNNKLNIGYELSQKSTVSIDLYDLQGQFIKNVLPAAEFETGLIRQTAVIDIENGIYILAASSNLGERVTLKIIK